MPASEPAPERPPRGRSVGGQSIVKSRGFPKPPQGHGGYGKAKRSKACAERKPPRYSNRSSKPRMLEVALALAEERGYEAMRIGEITDVVGVTRQAFYAHFHDKRHCLCEAIDPRLASIERIAAAALREQDEQRDEDEQADGRWAAELLRTIDETLAERFGSREGTRGRLLDAMAAELQGSGSLAGVRIGKLVRAAHVPQGDFYRCFTGKRECFAVLYEQQLDSLLEELGERASVEQMLEGLGRCLAADPKRLEILILGGSELPEREVPDLLGSRQGALVDALSKLLAACEREDVDPADLRVIAGSLVEVIRGAVLSGRVETLPATLVDVAEGLPGAPANSKYPDRASAIAA